jgi:hypothetical protein
MNNIQSCLLQITFINSSWVFLLIIIIAIVIIAIIFLFWKPKNTKNILFLAINPEYENLIQDLKENRQVTSNNYQDLFKATRSLCLVSDAHIFQELNNWFNEIEKKPEMSKDDEFELDIYIVKMVLTQEYPGLKNNASLVERLDAFKEISEKSQEVFVSPRLSPEDYQILSRYLYQNS